MRGLSRGGRRHGLPLPLRPPHPALQGRGIYEGRELLIKDPSAWVNNSQWSRARLFVEELLSVYAERSLEDVLTEPSCVEAGDPMKELPLAASRSYGDYERRKRSY